MLVTSIFLTSLGSSYAKPAIDANTSEKNNADLTNFIGNPDQGRPKYPDIPPQWSGDDNGHFELLENPGSKVQEGSRQTENAAVLGDDVKAETVVSTDNENNRKTTDNGHGTRKPRDASNACIKRYEYHIIYNRVFRIAICKAGCKPKYMIVTFSNGQTKPIKYDCYK